MSSHINLSMHGNIAEVSFNRPETFNAFDLEMITAFADHLTKLATDESVRGVLISGSGKAFCTGGNLSWVESYAPKAGASFHALAAHLHRAVGEIRRMEKPVCCLITGMAAGAGFSLALASDFRIIEKSARMKQAYTSNGLSIDGGGTFTLPRLVGLARAMEIIAFDSPITAQQAFEWGLATKIADDGKGHTQAIELLNRLAATSMHSFGWSKKLLNDSFNNSLEYQLELERSGLAGCGDHPDGQEGISAFLEKRKPVFQKD